MRYVALIDDVEPDPGSVTPDEVEKTLAEYGAVDAAVKAARIFRGGEASTWRP